MFKNLICSDLKLVAGDDGGLWLAGAGERVVLEEVVKLVVRFVLGQKRVGLPLGQDVVVVVVVNPVVRPRRVVVVDGIPVRAVVMIRMRPVRVGRIRRPSLPRLDRVVVSRFAFCRIRVAVLVQVKRDVFAEHFIRVIGFFFGRLRSWND